MPAPVTTTKGREASLIAVTSAPVLGPLTMILMADGHNFQLETDFVSDVVGDEIAPTGYSRQVVAWSAVNANVVGVVAITAEPTNFGVIGGAVDATTSGCYLFADTGLDSTSPIYHCIPFVEAKTTDGTDFRVTANTFTWSPSPF